MIFSASSIEAWQKMGNSMYYLNRHLLFLVLGTFLSIFVMGMDYRKLKIYSKPLLIFSTLLLILILMPGISREIGGAKRWFRFFSLNFQPSEFAQIAMIVYIAEFISRKKTLTDDFWHGFIPVIAILGFVVFLILMQPDLGTVVALSIVVIVMMYISGLDLRYVFSLFLLAMPVLFILIFSVPYRRIRMLTFLNPWADPEGSGFQLIQSQIALGSGGIFGVGLGMSKEKLLYLPAAHTDFIFSIIGEELGFLGVIATITLFFLFLYYGFKIAYSVKDSFGHYLSFGLVLLITLKALINMGVSCALLPTKGLPLPFISYGGSSLIFDMISVALLLNIAKSGD
jgi:cell division protein FtsW